MGAIILGILVGAMFATIIGLVLELIYDSFYYYGTGVLVRITQVVLIVGLLIGGGLFGGNMEYHRNRQWYESYIVQKQTIETSLLNTKLSGFERIELVKQASELNSTLAKCTYSAQQWYGFLSDPRVIEAEYVNLNTK